MTEAIARRGRSCLFEWWSGPPARCLRVTGADRRRGVRIRPPRLFRRWHLAAGAPPPSDETGVSADLEPTRRIALPGGENARRPRYRDGVGDASGVGRDVGRAGRERTSLVREVVARARACRSGAGRRHQFRSVFGGLCGGPAPESGGIADAGAPRTGPSWRTVRGWDRPGNGVAAEPRRSQEPSRTSGRCLRTGTTAGSARPTGQRGRGLSARLVYHASGHGGEPGRPTATVWQTLEY